MQSDRALNPRARTLFGAERSHAELTGHEESELNFLEQDVVAQTTGNFAKHEDAQVDWLSFFD